MEKNHYELLGVDPSASRDDLRKAYYATARMYHPDNVNTGNRVMFERVRAAYSTLIDPRMRVLYDRDHLKPKILDFSFIDEAMTAIRDMGRMMCNEIDEEASRIRAMMDENRVQSKRNLEELKKRFRR